MSRILTLAAYVQCVAGLGLKNGPSIRSMVREAVKPGSVKLKEGEELDALLKKDAFKVFVINLDRRPDRMERFVDAMRSSEPWMTDKVCRVPAVDGSAITKKDTEDGGWAHGKVTADTLEHLERVKQWGIDQNNTNLWPRLTFGGMGLFLSHAKAWDAIANGPHDFGVVMEDDLTLYAPNFAPQFARILDSEDGKIPKNWDVIQLQACWVLNGWLRNSDAEEWHLPNFARNRAVLDTRILPGAFPCTAAYAMSKKAAAAALKAALPVTPKRRAVDLGSLKDNGLTALFRKVKLGAQLFDGKVGWGIPLDENVQLDRAWTEWNLDMYRFFPVIAQADQFNEKGSLDSDVQGSDNTETSRDVVDLRQSQHKAPVCPGLETETWR